MSGIRGDFERLKELELQLKRLASGEARRELWGVAAEAAVKALDDSFARGHDPYGKSWAPLTSRAGKPLLDTGSHLRSTLAPKVTPGGFVISTAFPGAPVHQYGAVIRAKGKALAFRAGGVRPRGHGRGRTGGQVFARSVTIPRRQFMPEGELGPFWTKAITAAAEAYMRDAMKQGT
jgi:phage gpG-like protein